MMNQKLSAALMAATVLIAAPAFAQSSATKQPTQSETPSMAAPAGNPSNADPSYKQHTQEGGPSMQGPTGGNFNADPNYSPAQQNR
jgi:hypothetical protein